MENTNFILRGWRELSIGERCYGGDKYWDDKLRAWLPVTVNNGWIVESTIPVIRKGE